MLERLGVAALFAFAIVDHAGIPATWLGAVWYTSGQGSPLWVAILLGVAGGLSGDLMWWQLGRLASARQPKSPFDHQGVLAKVRDAATRLGPITAVDILVCRLFPATNQFLMAAAGASGRPLLSTAALSLFGNGLLFGVFGSSFAFWRAYSPRLGGVGMLLAAMGVLLLVRRWRGQPGGL